MGLQSQSFRNDPKLEAAAVSDAAHIMPGAVGGHVAKIQRALILLDKAAIDPAELPGAGYGPSTAAAVLAFKQARNIINRSYQSQADNIVGRMTVAALDREMFQTEAELDAIKQKAAIAKAYATIPEALGRIRTARARLFALKPGYLWPTPLFPSGRERRIAEWNFKLHKAADPVTQIDRVLAVYDRMEQTLFMASRARTSFGLFLPSKGDPKSPGVPAYTTAGGYYYGIGDRDSSGEYRKAIYITPEYANKVRAAEILIHELAHYCGGKEGSGQDIQHRARPFPPPRGVRKEYGQHDYAGMTAEEASRNAYSYPSYCYPESLGNPPN